MPAALCWPRCVTVVFAILVTACSEAPLITQPAAPPVARWVGSYSGQSRFGATGGSWGNGGTYPLVVASTGDVTVGGRPLVGAVYDAGTAQLRWTIAAGNATNGEVTFHETLTSDYFFRDLANATAGRGFTGYIQRPGEGRLDYRGLPR